MVLRRTSIAARASPAIARVIAPVLSAERQKVAALISVFVHIDKRIEAIEPKAQKRKVKTKKGLQIKFSQALLYLMATLFLIQPAPRLWLKIQHLGKRMIDTIVLTLSQASYQLHDSGKFILSRQSTSLKGMAISSGMQSKQKPLKSELLQGIYKPRLSLFHPRMPQGQKQVHLKIELSLPKLFFGNNLNELRLKDFQALCAKLSAVLQEMGVTVSVDALAQAPISAVHYSKNIALTDGSTPYHYINKIRDANIKLSLDVNQTDYRNEGHSYKWHCNSYEVVFYDKIRDLEKAKQSDKRALEKDNALQLHLFDRLRKRRKLEILRMEVRLNKRQKIKSLFKGLKIKSDLTFKSIFKPAISKKILLHYLNELESKRPALIDYKAANGKALLADLIFNNPELGPKRILQLFGLKQALELMSARELQQMFAKCSKRSWSRLMVDASEARLPMEKKPLKIIREKMETFKTIRIKQF